MNEAILFTLASVVPLALWAYLKISALSERCRYLEHLIGGVLLREAHQQPQPPTTTPERFDGDEWKDGVIEED